MFQRAHLQIIIGRLKEPRRFIQVITGPRQVGKTTLVTQLTHELNIPFTFISADSVAVSNTNWLRQQWETTIIRMEQQEQVEHLFIVDEIQKIENWSETVKLLWDKNTRDNINLKVILLGSSRLLLQQGLTESLAGRFENIYMGHWSFNEMHTAFGWDARQYAWFGGYPGSADLIKDEQRWKNYVQHSLIETSISKDVLMLSRVDKPALMKRLFDLGCIYSGKILSYTKILGQLQDKGNTTTISHYLELLDTAGLLAGIEKYTKEEIRTKSSSPKFQVHNTAFISAQRHETLKEITGNPIEWGHIVESSVGAHLLNYSLTGAFKLSYWRDRDNEVDFIIERKNKLIAVEVKSGTDKSVSGMTAFAKQFNPSKMLLVGDTGISWQEFLRIDPVELF